MVNAIIQGQASMALVKAAPYGHPELGLVRLRYV
jgi:hypothetical protein